VPGAAALGATAETLERLPAPALIVDRDIRVLAGNRAARALVPGCRPGDGTGHRVGELLGCVHAQGDGCGVRKECLACVIRRSVERALAGEPMERTPASLRILAGAGTRELSLHVAAAALRESGCERALLTL
jgi:hypothetical protein